MSLWVRSSQARRPGSPDLAPLTHQLAGVPVDALPGLFVQVQADAVDVGGDVFVRVAVGSAHQGSEGITDFPAFDVGHHRFKIAGPRKVLDAAADGRLVLRGAGSQLVELQRILQRLVDGRRNLLVHVLHKAAEPLQVVPDGPVEFGGAVPDHAVVRHALVQFLGQLQRRLQPGRCFCHAGALDLERLHLVGQRQRLQEEQFHGELFRLAGGALEVLPEVGHHGRLGVRHSPFQAFQQLCRGVGRPGQGLAVQGRGLALQARTEHKPRGLLDLLGDAEGAVHCSLGRRGHMFKFTGSSWVPAPRSRFPRTLRGDLDGAS